MELVIASRSRTGCCLDCRSGGGLKASITTTGSRRFLRMRDFTAESGLMLGFARSLILSGSPLSWLTPVARGLMILRRPQARWMTGAFCKPTQNSILRMVSLECPPVSRLVVSPLMPSIVALSPGTAIAIPRTLLTECDFVWATTSLPGKLRCSPFVR